MPVLATKRARATVVFAPFVMAYIGMNAWGAYNTISMGLAEASNTIAGAFLMGQVAAFGAIVASVLFIHFCNTIPAIIDNIEAWIKRGSSTSLKPPRQTRRTLKARLSEAESQLEVAKAQNQLLNNRINSYKMPVIQDRP